MMRETYRLSGSQRELLSCLKDGCVLTFRSMVRARLTTASGKFIAIPDSRALSGLWQRKLVEISERDPAYATDVRYFTITPAGLECLKVEAS